MGVKISDATQFGSAQLNDLFAAARGSTSGSLSNSQILDLAEDQLFQKNSAIELLTISGGQITPDLADSYVFYTQFNTSGAELQLPDNPPYNGVRFTVFIYAGASAGSLTFESGYVRLGGAEDVSLVNGDVSRVDIWYVGSGEAYYTITPPETAVGVVQNFDVTIASADVLTSNATPVEVIAAPGSGYFIDVQSCFTGLVDGTSLYTSNVNGFVLHSGQTIGSYAVGTANLGSLIVRQQATVSSGVCDSLANIDNVAVNYQTITGNPATGDYDLRIWGTYIVRTI